MGYRLQKQKKEKGIIMTTSLFNKIILFTTDMYIDRMRKENTQLPKTLEQLSIALVGYKHHNRFTDKEAEYVLKLAKDPGLDEVVKTDVSPIIFTLTIIKLWVESIDKKDRPNLNISDKKLIKGRAEYAIQMIKLKKEKPEIYEEKREIIDSSVETAQRFMEFHLNKLNNKEK